MQLMPMTERVNVITTCTHGFSLRSRRRTLRSTKRDGHDVPYVQVPSSRGVELVSESFDFTYVSGGTTVPCVHVVIDTGEVPPPSGHRM